MKRLYLMLHTATAAGLLKYVHRIAVLDEPL
jgi:hypothetical protein